MQIPFLSLLSVLPQIYLETRASHSVIGHQSASHGMELDWGTLVAWESSELKALTFNLSEGLE